MALMKPAYMPEFFERWREAMKTHPMGAGIGNASVATNVGVNTAALARMAAREPHKLGLTPAVGTAPISVRLCVPTPNPSNGSRGSLGKAIGLAKKQRAAVEAALFGQVPPPAPWVVTLTRASAGAIAGDGLQTALKRIRDSVAVFLLGGRQGERDDDPSIRWVYATRPGKRNQPCVDIEITTRKDEAP